MSVCLPFYISILSIHRSQSFVYKSISNTNNARTPSLVVHSRHVAAKPLSWWGGWAHWIVFMTSLYTYYALSFVLVEHSVCHEPIFVLYLCMYVCYIYKVYIYIERVYKNLAINSIVRLLILGAEILKVRKCF